MSRSSFCPFTLRAAAGIGLSLTLCLGLRASQAGTAFVDPLDAPAERSALAAGSLLQAVARAGDRLVAVGWRGHILTSDDAGRSWSAAEVPVQSDLLAVHFPSARQGWAVGHGGVVLHSTDGGRRWARQLDGRQAAGELPAFYAERAAAGDQAAQQALAELKLNFEAGADKPWLDVWFDDERHGFAVGAFGMLMATDDGGAHWQPWLDRIDNPQGLHLNAVRGVAGEVYIAAEQGLVFRLDRAAGRFVARPTGYSGSLFGLAGDAQRLVAFGLRGTVFASTDRGEHWQRLALEGSDSWFAGALLADGRLVLVGQAAELRLSATGAAGAAGAAATFTRQALDLATPLTAALPLAAHELLVLGAGGAHRIDLLPE